MRQILVALCATFTLLIATTACNNGGSTIIQANQDTWAVEQQSVGQNGTVNASHGALIANIRLVSIRKETNLRSVMLGLNKSILITHIQVIVGNSVSTVQDSDSDPRTVTIDNGTMPLVMSGSIGTIVDVLVYGDTSNLDGEQLTVQVVQVETETKGEAGSVSALPETMTMDVTEFPNPHIVYDVRGTVDTQNTDTLLVEGMIINPGRKDFRLRSVSFGREAFDGASDVEITVNGLRRTMQVGIEFVSHSYTAQVVVPAGDFVMFTVTANTTQATNELVLNGVSWLVESVDPVNPVQTLRNDVTTPGGLPLKFRTSFVKELDLNLLPTGTNGPAVMSNLADIEITPRNAQLIIDGVVFRVLGSNSSLKGDMRFGFPGKTNDPLLSFFDIGERVVHFGNIGVTPTPMASERIQLIMNIPGGNAGDSVQVEVIGVIDSDGRLHIDTKLGTNRLLG